MNDKIFIAFDNKKIAAAIAKILISNGNDVVAISKTSSELINTLRYYNGGIIITGCDFDGVRNENILDEIPDEFNIVVVDNKVNIDNFPDGRAFKLSMPLQKNDLICSVDMFMTMETKYKPSLHKNQNNEKIIAKAKSLLIDMYSMSEEQAHRYIQKKSMDTGRKLVDIAKIILDV